MTGLHATFELARAPERSGLLLWGETRLALELLRGGEAEGSGDTRKAEPFIETEAIIWRGELVPEHEGSRGAASEGASLDASEGAGLHAGEGASGSTSLCVPRLEEAIFVPPLCAFELLVGLAKRPRTDLHLGPSVEVLVRLAIEAAATASRGMILPGLERRSDGTYSAIWKPAKGACKEADLSALSRRLPLARRAEPARPSHFSSCSSVLAGAIPPPPGGERVSVAETAFLAMLDAHCRESLVGASLHLMPTPTPPGMKRAVAAWLDGLAKPDPTIDPGRCSPEELAELADALFSWGTCPASVSANARRPSDLRLCLRLHEPEDEPRCTLLVPPSAPGAHRAGPNGASDQSGVPEPERACSPTWSPPWRLEILLQSLDDRSLLIPADMVWRSSALVAHLTRAQRAPDQVLAAELAKATRVFPRLSEALSERAPCCLDLDVTDAHEFLVQAAETLRSMGFGVLLPAWWQNDRPRLGLRLRITTAGPTASFHGTCTSREGIDGRDDQVPAYEGTTVPSLGASSTPPSRPVFSSEALTEFSWTAALGETDLDEEELKSLAAIKAPLVKIRGRYVELRPGEADDLLDFLRDRRAAKLSGESVADAVRQAARLGLEGGSDRLPRLVGMEANGSLASILFREADHLVDSPQPPPGFDGELRPYQQRALAWLAQLERLGLGACLADDMGLGKTATVLALLAGGGRPSLVVCPTSVVGNWQREVERFTPQLSLYVHHGPRRSLGARLMEQASRVDLVVTTYAMLDRDADDLRAVAWHRLVLDEAQYVKNPSTKQSIAARSIPARHRIALTGTPVENHLLDLWSIMDFLNPGILGSLRSFQERIARPVERNGDEGAGELLRRITAPFVMRRSKADPRVISDLPEKQEIKVWCNLTEEQATLYQAVVDEMLERIDSSTGSSRRAAVLEAILRLKQVCNHPAHFLGDHSPLEGRSGKLERTVDILEHACEAGEKALVFTQFAEMGRMLAAHLEEHLCEPPRTRTAFLHGGLPRRERDQIVAKMQDPDSGLAVLVLSLRAGGSGLNLASASHVIHFDRWWNPAVEDQASDRAYRIGQRRTVQVRKLVCIGTLEERLDQMLDAKRDLAARAVADGESFITELSTEELAELFRLSEEAVVFQP
jgi:superfamily II DNA or RNA helicase